MGLCLTQVAQEGQPTDEYLRCRINQPKQVGGIICTVRDAGMAIKAITSVVDPPYVGAIIAREHI